jgi:hypothetical protein
MIISFKPEATIQNKSALLGTNTLISIIEVKPINISELSQSSKTELLLQYQYFLRSLLFPIQIVLRFVNIDSDKFLYRKRMANTEQAIKSLFKIDPKNIIAEADEFKKWLKCYLEQNIRPDLLCYLVIPISANNNLQKNNSAYAEAMQLLNSRTKDCIKRLSAIRIRKVLKPTKTINQWEKAKLADIQVKKAMLGLRIFQKGKKYYSMDNLRPINNAKLKIKTYIKKYSFDELITEKESFLELRRLDDEQIENLFASYNKDTIAVSSGNLKKYTSVDELFLLWIRGGEK